MKLFSLETIQVIRSRERERERERERGGRLKERVKDR